MDSYLNSLSNNKMVKCLRSNFRNFFLIKGIEIDESYLEGILEGITVLYNSVNSVYVYNNSDDQDLKLYTPCSGAYIDLSGNIDLSGRPCWCDLNQFKYLTSSREEIEDLSGRVLTYGFPDISAGFYYREGFNRLLNSDYDYPYNSIQPSRYATDANIFISTDCRDGQWEDCLEGNSTECFRCLRISKLKDTDYTDWTGEGSISTEDCGKDDLCLERDPNGNCSKCIKYLSSIRTTSNSGDNRNYVNDKLLKIILYTIIIFFIILLFYLFFRKI